MNVFLKMKHWQLFILLFGAKVLNWYLLINATQEGSQPSLLVDTWVAMFMMLVVASWLWSIVTACLKVLPENLTESTSLVKVSLVYLIIYIASGVFIWEKYEAVWIILNLLAVVAALYTYDFTARQLVKLEQQKEVIFTEYAGSFVLLLFLPIGVWSIQPRVNKLLGTERNNETESKEGIAG